MSTAINEDVKIGRRNYDNCNISELEKFKIDHRFKTLEEDFEELKTSNKNQEKMLAEIHQKIMNSNNVILGIRMGVVGVVTFIILFFTVLSGVFTGQNSISDLIRLFH